jgi:uncharacterized protein YqeY
MIVQKLQQDQISAMKQKDITRLQTLRYILSQIKNVQIDKQRELSDEEVVAILRKEVKKLQDANVEFHKGGRKDLASENDHQISIIHKYLPQEISDDALISKIKELISTNESLWQKNKNAFIGFAISKLKNEASSNRIAEIIKNMDLK